MGHAVQHKFKLPATALAVSEARVLPIFVCVAGILAGLYFNVLVLLLVCLAGSVTFIFINLSLDPSSYVFVGDLLFLLILGQAGYMLGLTARGAYGHILARFHAAPSNPT
jgi:hypothetical protein